jgi:hypothetical protein
VKRTSDGREKKLVKFWKEIILSGHFEHNEGDEKRASR